MTTQVMNHPRVQAAWAEVERALARYEHAVADVISAGSSSTANEQRIRELETQLDKLQLRYIEATNPGIDMNEVRRSRSSTTP